MEIIPLIPAMAELQLMSCRMGYPGEPQSLHPSKQTVTFDGMMNIGTLTISGCTNLTMIQHWISQATRTVHLKITGMRSLPLSPTLLFGLGCLEIEIPSGRGELLCHVELHL